MLSVYVYNFASIGTNAAHVGEVGNAVLNGAHALWLKTHELSIDVGNFQLSGLSFSDTGSLRRKVRRQWKLWQALWELLRIGNASSRDISVVVGLLAMVRRELPSIFRRLWPLFAMSLNGCGRACPSDVGRLCTVE